MPISPALSLCLVSTKLMFTVYGIECSELKVSMAFRSRSGNILATGAPLSSPLINQDHSILEINLRGSSWMKANNILSVTDSYYTRLSLPS